MIALLYRIAKAISDWWHNRPEQPVYVLIRNTDGSTTIRTKEKKEVDEIFEAPKPPAKKLEKARVDAYMQAALQGLLSDGELALGRMNVEKVIDLAESLVREAIARADKMAEDG